MRHKITSRAPGLPASRRQDPFPNTTFTTRAGQFVIAWVAGLVLFGPQWTAAADAADRFVATTGSDAGNDCSVSANPCLSLQHAIDESISGDSIHVAAGTYPVAGLVTMPKTLTLLGAQAGVDARTRVGPETILSNTQGLSVAASGVVIDGFAIQNSINPAFTGYGVWLNPGVNGSQIVNNIFRDNIVGLGLSNGGASQAVVKHNLFQSNNLGGNTAAGASGIYTDEFVSGAVSNVLITENKFVDNANAGIGFSSNDPNFPSSNITITDNVIDQCGRGVYLFNTTLAVITGNSITNLTPPTDGGSSVGVGVFGGVSDLSILRNDVEGGPSRGIRIGNFFDANQPNTNVIIHLNNIFGFADAGLFVDNAAGFLPALAGPPDFATCNWWGSATGPTNPTLNPGGTGDAVKGALVTSNVNPWLLGLAPNAPCGTFAGSITIKKVAVGGDATFTYTATGLSPFTIATTGGLGEHALPGLTPGTYTVTESLLAGWDVTDVTCSGAATPPVTSVVNRDVTIVLGAGESVVCTFTNTRTGSIRIDKVALGGDASFNYTVTGSGLSNFTIATSGGTGSHLLTGPQGLLPGTYSVTEQATSGWNLDGVQCEGTATPATIVGGTVTLVLATGENAVCTYSNAKQAPPTASLIIGKSAQGGDGSFSFTTTGAGLSPFTLVTSGGEATHTFTGLAPGSYSVTESVPSGWTLTGILCTGTASLPSIAGPTVTLTLAAGETAHCTFDDTKLVSAPGSIIVSKVTEHANGVFQFTGTRISPFSITTTNNVGGHTISGLASGNYTITEVFPGTEWSLTSLTCVDPSGGTTTNVGTATASIALAPGETVVCTFTNRFTLGPPASIPTLSDTAFTALGILFLAAGWWRLRERHLHRNS